MNYLSYLLLFIAYFISSSIIYFLFIRKILKLSDDKFLIFKVFFITVFIPYIAFLLLSKIFPIIYNPLHSATAIGIISTLIVSIFLTLIKKHNEQKK